MKSTEADRELVNRLEGMYVGGLGPHEIESFNRCVADGYAQRTYEGFLGLAKIQLCDQVTEIVT